MECFDETFSECWTPEGITEYKTVVLRYLLQTNPSENTEEFGNKAVVANSINGRDSRLDEAHEFNDEEGNGDCSVEGYSEMQQLQEICAQRALAQFKPTRYVSFLSSLLDEVFLLCMLFTCKDNQI